MRRFRSSLCLMLLAVPLTLACKKALPACASYCSCKVACLQAQCEGANGVVQDCAEWGLCSTSCACGGQCNKPGDPASRLAWLAPAGPAAAQPVATCQPPSPETSPLSAIFN